jgi:hypothetical protein
MQEIKVGIRCARHDVADKTGRSLPLAELTHLDEKLAEVLGLAQVAQLATSKVSDLAREEDLTDLISALTQMGDEAEAVENRCQAVADSREGMKTAIKDKARETKAEVHEFMQSYLEDAEALDGLEFLTMAEAGEMIHWEILAKLNETAQDSDISELTDVAVPLQRGHVESVHEHALRLAAEEDPSETD